MRFPGGPNRFFLLSQIIQSTEHGPSTFADICEKTIQETRHQNDNDFSVTIEELKGFLGSSIIREVLKGRNEPVSRFWSDNYGRKSLIFGQTMSRKKYKDTLRYIRLERIDKKSAQVGRKIYSDS